MVASFASRRSYLRYRAGCFFWWARRCDRPMPDGDGLDLIPKLRARGIGVPIIVLTALGEMADRVAGLDTGADDYVAKPFAVEELLARLRAVLRRPGQLTTDTLRVGRLS